MWALAPCEIAEFIGEAQKGNMQMAWYIGMLHHTDPKKYPKKPEALWQSPELTTLEDMIAFALTVPEAPATEKS